MYKKLSVFLVSLGLLGGCSVANGIVTDTTQKITTTLSASRSSSEKTLTPEEEQQLKEEKEHQAMLNELPEVSTTDWNLDLVNNWTPIDQDITIPLTTLPNGYMIDERMKDAYDDWMSAASEAGYEIVLVSSFRSVDLQQTNYDSSIQRYIDQGHSAEEAKKMTEDYIAIPGGSEHHTGLAIDIVDADWLSTGKGLIPEYDTQESQHWLVDTMADYGFVLRFPQGKEDETGIEYESWHFRYVGVDNARYMEKYQLTLEEYIDLLEEAGK
ncbi:MAG: M15 family metallopeptidase [Carnobacterium sp.]|uniref:M15 family metallopeptidase n=1 Tax=Carnobacterium sp. TaxID=48221 RepID=UPI002FC6518C